MNSINEPDWQAAQARIIDGVTDSINRFAQENGDEICSFFALSVDYCFGEVFVCVDTLTNSILQARRHEARVFKARQAILATSNGWENAAYYLNRERLCTYTPDTANFAFPNITKINIDGWEEYFASDDLPDHHDPAERVFVVMHSIISSITSNGVVDQLNLSSPFQLGIEFPGDKLGLVVMKIVNWPT